MSDAGVAAAASGAGALVLARRLHDTVAQRLAATAYLLADEALSPATTLTCRREVQAALSELREALSSLSPGRSDDVRAQSATRETFRDLLPDGDLRWELEDVETGMGELLASFLAEAARNIRKHASPTTVRVGSFNHEGATVIDVVNDGVRDEQRTTCGVGRRLLETEASFCGALVEFREYGPGRWLQRLILPTGES